MSDETKKAVITSIIILLAVAFIVAMLAPIRQVRMVVRSCKWEYTIQEREDYAVWVCHMRHRENCMGSGKERKCRDEAYQDCGYETRTKVHNTWITGGEYPVAPFWDVYYIRPGNYERRWEEYTVMFSDDKELYPYRPASLEEYSKFIPRQAHDVKLNLFGDITGIVK